MKWSARLFALGQLVGPPVGREASAWATGRQLSRLVEHAGVCVPYYRELFKRHGLVPGEVRGLRDLPKIPVSSKKDLQAAGLAARIAEGRHPEQLFARTTSGTSGQPLTVCCNWFEESLLSALRVKAWMNLGVKPWDRLARLKVLLGNRKRPSWISTLQRWGFFRETSIDCLDPPGEILRQLRRLDPTVVTSFPGVLALVACENQGRRLPSLRRILVGGETLTPLLRSQLEEGFGVPVQNTYGSHEFNQIAVECKLSGLLHVEERNVILEILKDGEPVKPGESGEAVVTALHSFAMPFLRYRLGDILARGPESCECGRTGLTIERIEGRRADCLVFPDGRRIHPFLIIVELSHHFDWIRQYRLIQHEDGRLLIEVLPVSAPPMERLEKLEGRIREVLHGRLEVELAMVEKIDPGPFGKYRVCWSKLAEQLESVGSPIGASAAPPGAQAQRR